MPCTTVGTVLPRALSSSETLAVPETWSSWAASRWTGRSRICSASPTWCGLNGPVSRRLPSYCWHRHMLTVPLRVRSLRGAAPRSCRPQARHPFPDLHGEDQGRDPAGRGASRAPEPAPVAGSRDLDADPVRSGVAGHGARPGRRPHADRPSSDQSVDPEDCGFYRSLPDRG